MGEFPSNPSGILNLGILGSNVEACTFADALGFASSQWISATSVANRAYYIPFEISTIGVTAKYMGVMAGNTPAGNVDMGIYDENLVRLVSSGSVSMGAVAGAVISFDITDTALPPGTYYTGVAFDSSTAGCFEGNQIVGAILQATGVQWNAAAFPLPNPAVFTGGLLAAGNVSVPTVAIAFETAIL